VFNAGEQVEGQTNLLSTLLLAGAMALGISPKLAAEVLAVRDTRPAAAGHRIDTVALECSGEV
jgi:hypothetical protein